MTLSELKEMCAKICDRFAEGSHLYGILREASKSIRAIELPDEDTVTQVDPADVRIGAVKLPSLPLGAFLTGRDLESLRVWYSADQMRAYALAAIAAQPAPVPEGWTITRQNISPGFPAMNIKAPNGFSTNVSFIDRNPANILYMLAEALLTAAGSANNASLITPMPDYDHNEGDGLAGRVQQEAPAGTGSVLSTCPCCPIEVRDLYAVAHNTCVDRKHLGNGDLKRAVDKIKPLIDAHFSGEAHVLASQPIPTISVNADKAFDDDAVGNFAEAMKAKLDKKREQGRGGWNDKVRCTQEQLSSMLLAHVEKGDPVDVANFAMMLHQRMERVVLPSQPSAQEVRDAAIEQVAELVEKRVLCLPASLLSEIRELKSAPISKQDAPQPSAGFAKHSDNILGGAGGPQPTTSQFASKADYEAAASKQEQKS